MHRSLRSLLTGTAVGLAALSVVSALSACQPPGHGGGGGSSGGSGSSSGGTSGGGTSGGNGKSSHAAAGCRNPGSQTKALLPDFSDSTFPVVSDLNPCLPSTALIQKVVTGLSSPDREMAGSNFLDKLGTFSERLDKLADVQECAYKTDRLALGVYHHRDYPWSIGSVAIVRGGPGAVLDTAVCYLLKQVRFLLPASDGEGVTVGAPVQAPCLSIAQVHQDGQTYTVLWIGSSDVMCEKFKDTYTALIPGSGPTVTVTGDPSLAIRSGPSTKERLILRVPYGTIGRAICDTGSGWVKVDVDDTTGYASKDYLDIDAGTDLASC